jgi:hypothetical protein
MSEMLIISIPLFLIAFAASSLLFPIGRIAQQQEEDGALHVEILALARKQVENQERIISLLEDIKKKTDS